MAVPAVRCELLHREPRLEPNPGHSPNNLSQRRIARCHTAWSIREPMAGSNRRRAVRTKASSNRPRRSSGQCAGGGTACSAVSNFPHCFGDDACGMSSAPVPGRTSSNTIAPASASADKTAGTRPDDANTRSSSTCLVNRHRFGLSLRTAGVPLGHWQRRRRRGRRGCGRAGGAGRGRKRAGASRGRRVRWVRGAPTRDVGAGMGGGGRRPHLARADPSASSPVVVCRLNT